MPSIPRFTNYITPTKKPTRSQFKKVTLAFHSWVLYHLFEKIHSEFIIKSRGGTDSMGVQWKPLAEKTKIYKPLRRGEVSQTIRRKLRSGKYTKKELLADREPLINIDTGRLLRSLQPGMVSSGRYFPPSADQKVSITLRGFAFNIQVPYADKVQEVRPFLPENYDPWVQESIQKSISMLQIEMANNALI